MIVLEENDFILKLFSAISPAGTSDVLMVSLVRDGRLCGFMCFRHHAGAGLDAPDKISSYKMDPTDDTPAERERIHASMREVLDTAGSIQICEQDVNGKSPALFAALTNVPGMLTRMTPQGEERIPETSVIPSRRN